MNLKFIKKTFLISIFLTILIPSTNVYGNINNINSRSYVILDRNSNKILLSKNINEKRKMASTTKIMTGIIIIENCNLKEQVTISKSASIVGGSKLGLKPNDKISINDLLYGLLLKSGNDCAIALAEYYSGSIENFSIIMNNKAKKLRSY